MPKQLTKKDVKDVAVSAFGPFARAMQSDFLKVNKRLDRIEEEAGDTKTRLTHIAVRLTHVETDVKWMKDNFSALFTKLDKLISLYEEQKQELLMLGAQFKRLEERVAN